MAETRTSSFSTVTHPDVASVRPLNLGTAGDLTRDVFGSSKPLEPLLDLLKSAGMALHDAVELEVPVAGAGIVGDFSGPLEIAVDVGSGRSSFGATVQPTRGANLCRASIGHRT